ncbi:MAG TPA: sugar ABC transporter substrate-binding protein [Vicinamibacteria bacterium]|nr:sugar ABC transporter substrate-binding protein [Vicinamibacteria bacterium]
MAERRLALFLVDAANAFQQLLRTDAEQAAQAAGLGLVTRFSGFDVASQLTMLQACLDGVHRPDGILVMCVHDRGLDRFIRRAAHAGAHVLLLNTLEDDLEAIRAEEPGRVVATVCPDEVETGRIQGRQFRRLLPSGGRVLYVQGRARSTTARRRTEGVLEALAGTDIRLLELEAGWTLAEAREAVAGWLRVALRASRRVDLVGCQNDELARGALQALVAVAAELGRPEAARIPVTGCDGAPGQGQEMVNRGELAATVVLPRTTGPAVELLARAFRTGQLPPPLVLLQPRSFPAEPQLRPSPLAVTASA